MFKAKSYSFTYIFLLAEVLVIKPETQLPYIQGATQNKKYF